jgi:hypothetical protein
VVGSRRGCRTDGFCAVLRSAPARGLCGRRVRHSFDVTPCPGAGTLECTVDRPGKPRWIPMSALSVARGAREQRTE